MNVTSSTLRDMILAELGAVDEDAVVTRTSARGVPSQDLASMSTEDVEGILRQKAGGLSSKMAEFISAMVDAGWDRDQFIRNLAGMDDDILVTLLAPAMRESYDRAVQLLAEAIGTPCPAVDGDDGTLMTVGQFRRLVREALDYDPEFSKFPEGRQPGPRELRLDESTLMTVGQFRRLVRETAGGDDKDRARWKANSIAMANEIADTLISSGPLPNYGDILDALAKHVYRKQGLVNFIDFRSEMTGLQDKEIFSMWIDKLDDPGDDLQMLQMALTRDVGDNLQLSEGDSVTMTLGRFRRVIREAGCPDWDNMADDAFEQRDDVAQHILRTSWPGDMNFDYWKDLVKAHLQIVQSPYSMDALDAAIAECAKSGGSGHAIVRAAVARAASNADIQLDEGGDVKGEYAAGSSQMAGAQTKAASQSSEASSGAASGTSQAQAAQDEVHRIHCKSISPERPMVRVGEASAASDEEGGDTDEECVRHFLSLSEVDLDEGPMADAIGEKGQELMAAMDAVKAALKKLSPEEQEQRAAEVNREQELLILQLNKLIEDLG